MIQRESSGLGSGAMTQIQKHPKQIIETNFSSFVKHHTLYP
jgi:hypothetical protein